MSKSTRFTECRDALFADRLAGRPIQREHMKRWGAMRVAAQQGEDVLESRRTFFSRHFALGALRAVCYRAGKTNDWIDQRLYRQLDRNEDLHRFDVLRRIDACDIKFLPSRIRTAA